jgi:alanine dehydrogenase
MTMTQAPVFLSNDAVEAVFAWPDAISALAEAYAADMPASATPRRAVGNDGSAWLRTLPALPAAGRYFGAKVMGMSLAAAEPGVEYVIVLFDRESSRIAALVDAHRVTSYRTAATSAAALDRLAPSGPIRLGVLGSGEEATTHVRAFAAVRPIVSLSVFSTTPQRREAFAAAATADLGIAAEAVESAQAAVTEADVVLAAARSHGEVPILFGDWLKPTATVVSIGSVVPNQREIDSSVVATCDLMVCDTVEEVVEETGDMLAAARAGVDVSDRVYSLHQLLRGDIDELVERARRPLFKSVGAGIQDVVVAEVLVRKAMAEGLVTSLPAFDKKI